MFEPLISYFKKQEYFNGTVEHNVRVLIEHFHSETPRIKEIFSRINRKYNYDNYDSLVDLKSFDTHIEFWRGSGEFDLAVMQASLNGVYDPDPEFGHFYDQYSSNLWRLYQDFENDAQAESFYLISYDLFYTWVANLWQELHSEFGGFPVKLMENNAATCFSLVDFAWFDNSCYHEFLEKPLRRKILFQRKLSINEIFSRVKIPYQLRMECTRKLYKDNNYLELVINENSISLKNMVTEEVIYNVPITKATYQNSILYVQKHNELLNDNWSDITYV